MILVKFGGDWPWGTDEIEECHGYFDAAHVVDEHGPKGVGKNDPSGQAMVKFFSALLRLGRTGSVSLGQSRFMESKRR